MRRLALLILLLACAAGLWLSFARDRDAELAAPPALASDAPARSSDALDRAPAPAPVATAGEARTQLAVEPETSADPVPADPKPGVAFHGRVVSSAGGTPVPFARITVRDEAEEGVEGSAVEADADGRFSLTLVLRKGRADLGVTAPGFSTGYALASRGYEDPARACVVWLTPHASLDVAARGPDGAAVRGLAVYMRAPSWSLRKNDTLVPWSMAGGVEDYADVAGTGADGVARFESVPAEILLFPSVLGPNVDRRLDAIALRPGEHRVLELSIAPPVTVEGSALRPDGAPAEALVLWLVDVAADTPPSKAGMPRYLQEQDEERVVAKAITDAGGRFLFESVAPGRYWIGPPEPPDGAAALAEALEVRAQGAYLELVLAPALAIRGTVVDEREAPYEAYVSARATSATGSFHQKAEGGSFAFERLAPGRYTLSIGGERVFGPLDVDAGAEDVVLRVVPSSSVHGRVVARRAPDVGIVVLELSATDSFAKYSRYVTGGVDTFEIAAPHGRYSFRASTSDDWIGTVADVVLEPGRVTELPPVELVRAQRLHVRNDGERTAVVQVVAERAELGSDSLYPGAARVFLVPAGPVTVRLLDDARVPCDETTVTVEAGVPAAVSVRCP